MKSPPTQLGTLVNEVSTWNPSRDHQDKEFTYIDLGSIDQATKAITGARKISCGDAPSRARQLVKPGDILVSTVRPNLNGVAKISDALGDATASTGFCVLRPQKDRLDSSYLFHWVKTRSFVDAMVKQATGASYPAVSDKIIFSSKLPLPPLPEQRRIAAILDEADALRAQRRIALAKLDELLQSVFIEIFGDPVTNPKRWPLVNLSELGMLDRGISKHRPRGAPELLGGMHPLIQTGDVARSDGYIRRYTTTYSDVGLAQSKKWPAGTLCITIAANIAETGILTFDACFPDSVVGFTPNEKCTVEFVQKLFGFLQSILEDRAPQSAQKNINLAILRSLEVPRPPRELQQRFARIAEKIESQKQTMQLAAEKTENLFASLQQLAFSGKL